MASNPNNPNRRDEPVGLLEAAAERGPDDAGHSGPVLDSESVPMDVDDNDDDEDGGFYSESVDEEEEEEDDDNDDDEEEEDGEEEEDNQMELSGDDEEEGCDQSGGGGGGDCLICFRSWKSEGRHRICCPPCGHVYGRSCLEKWRKRHGKNTGKCPQCKRKFKQQDIINLYGQLTAVTNDDIVAPSEVMSRDGNVGREGGHRVEGGETTQTRDEQGWWLTKESWDTMCSRVDTLSTRNEELHTRLHAFEGRIMKIVEGFGVKLDEMLDATGERLGKKVDENFKKLFEFCKNPSDTSKNPFDISSPNVGVAPPPIEASLEKILEAMEERIGQKMYENFKKGFEAYGIQFGSPSPRFGPTPSSSMPEDTAS